MLIECIENLDKKKVLVRLEDGSFFPLYKGDIRKYAIEEAKDIDEEAYNYIMSELVYKRGRERALYILKSSDKTEKQLRDKLTGGNYPPVIIDRIVGFLKGYGYIDDYSYALSYVKAYAGVQSMNMMKSKLALKGIDKNTLNSVIDEYMENNEYDADKLIYDILRKKRFNYDSADIKEKNKIISHLMRKGFKYDNIIECIKNFNKNMNTQY